MRFVFITLLIIHSGIVSAQRFYRTSGGELIFSRPVNNSPFPDAANQTRFSAFFHYNNNFHYNLTSAIGCFSGISISNIGFIYKVGDTTFKKRVYAIGIPLAIKFGNLSNNNFIFAGGEIEFPIHYKQKKIIGSHKLKYSTFFNDRVNPFLPSIFAGIQFKGGSCLKFRFYLSDFLNKEFVGSDFGLRTEYKNTHTQLFLLSLSFNLKKNKNKKVIINESRFALL
jgi:hypothetical protein